jgi:SAM-dependent methyltransferase
MSQLISARRAKPCVRRFCGSIRPAWWWAPMCCRGANRLSWPTRKRCRSPGVLLQIRRALKPDGLFLAALFGGETLTELRQSFAAAESEIEGGVSPRVAPFADLRDLGGLLQRAGFALPVTDVDRLTVRYDSVFGLLRDLRRMGATNSLVARRRKPLRRATLRRMTEIYALQFADHDGRIRATFDIVWLSGWAPHPDQQQPLKPGSAKARLADALGVREISAGEKASR